MGGPSLAALEATFQFLALHRSVNTVHPLVSWRAQELGVP